ncbi:class I SAM-dependent methyltransferase [Arthrobacter sp. EH-1B-1]|uniref:Class I SAM-dependent methyltransferase n=1 Tax=Arthrobacter vasquezii TaxID=2977629 RepID=A0ABT6CYW8_9MICC|nr:class I SAM-dependent methyltransferase [Arthrobacter vasquezii]MDF9279280.1 class I SAM-dependent methyltransferase [Arthrobacter vasquezii]
MCSEVSDGYARRAMEYAEHLGSMAAVHPSDRQLVDTWAASIVGQVIDAGCGPGHWTHHLVQQGLSASGVDLVPDFIDRARTSYPGVPFDVGNLDAIDVADGTVGGVLSWYSLIHHEPDTIQVPLGEFARVICPGGGLLIGFFEGPKIESFDHAVVTAYHWPTDALSHELRVAGFDIVEAHTRTGLHHRPHGAVVARRADTP